MLDSDDRWPMFIAVPSLWCNIAIAMHDLNALRLKLSVPPEYLLSLLRVEPEFHQAKDIFRIGIDLARQFVELWKGF